eukprot:511187_1
MMDGKRTFQTTNYTTWAITTLQLSEDPLPLDPKFNTSELMAVIVVTLIFSIAAFTLAQRRITRRENAYKIRKMIQILEQYIRKDIAYIILSYMIEDNKPKNTTNKSTRNRLLSLILISSLCVASYCGVIFVIENIEHMSRVNDKYSNTVLCSWEYDDVWSANHTNHVILISNTGLNACNDYQTTNGVGAGMGIPKAAQSRM